MRLSAMLATLVTVLGVCSAVGQEPPPVPPPEFVPPPYLLPQPIRRIDRYAVWQGYAVDRQGYFRPRVVDVPLGGAYYAADGRPFPFINIHPTEYMPHASE